MQKSGVFPGNTEEEEKVNTLIDKRQQEITFREFEGKPLTPWQTAYNMFNLFTEVVTNTEWKDGNELKENFIKVCERLIERDRLNFVVRNCSERMLQIFKQKCYELKIDLKTSQGQTSIQSLRHLTLKKIMTVQDDSALTPQQSMGTTSTSSTVDENPFGASQNSTEFDFRIPEPAMQRRATMAPPKSTRNRQANRISIVDVKRQKLSLQLRLAITETLEEIELSKDEVTEQAQEHVSDNDLILTYHTSNTLTNFFIAAKEKANFEVIVCETAPKFTGHETA